jgi:NAD-dependent dihydropyrimidine dehydrogenase PreA subunit
MDIEQVLANLRKNRFEASYFATKEEAAAYLNSKIDGKVVGLGDSQTILALGLYESLSKHNEVHDVAHSPINAGKTFADYAKTTLLTDIFLCSANAVAATGEVVNMDGTGNRVAASLFGHEKVYYVVGINKICPDLDKAIWRVRNVAAPQNAKRKHKKTPCAIKGDKCYNCMSPERICNGLLIEFKKMSNMDMEVVIIGEELGF